MKSNDEILASWDTEGRNTDWYAIDSLNEIDGRKNRLFVGTKEDAHKMMCDYYAVPDADRPYLFHRCTLIGENEALDYFKGIRTELDESGVISATEAAEMLGVSRMRVNQLLNAGKLDGFKHDGTWSVYKESVESRIASQSRRLFQQHELDAFLGGFADDFDVDAIIEDSTEIIGGSRYWKDDVDLGEICAKHDKSI